MGEETEAWMEQDWNLAPLMDLIEDRIHNTRDS